MKHRKNKLLRWPRDKQRGQLYEWIHQAIQTKWGPEDLERFFTNNLTNDERQRLLNMPRANMEAELERLHLKSDPED